MSISEDREFTRSSPAQKLAMKCERLFQQHYEAEERGDCADAEWLEAFALDAKHDLERLVGHDEGLRLRNRAHHAIHAGRA